MPSNKTECCYFAIEKRLEGLRHSRSTTSNEKKTEPMKRYKMNFKDSDQFLPSYAAPLFSFTTINFLNEVGKADLSHFFMDGERLGPIKQWLVSKMGMRLIARNVM